MKKFLTIISLVILMIAGTAFGQDSLQVQNQKKFQKGKRQQKLLGTEGQRGVGFVDADGDGYNDNAPDADGDGIPNGMDPDYKGSQARKGNPYRGFIDLNGDGINDNALDDDGDGIPNGQDPDYIRPQDGSGPGNVQSGKGSGSQSGTGSGMGSESGGHGKKGSKKGGRK